MHSACSVQGTSAVFQTMLSRGLSFSSFLAISSHSTRRCPDNEQATQSHLWGRKAKKRAALEQQEAPALRFAASSCAANVVSADIAAWRRWLISLRESSVECA